MSILEEVKERLDILKKPSMSLNLVHNISKEPKVESYVGGHPFVTKNEAWPNCSACNKKMRFLFQLKEKNVKGYISLNVYFFCDCLLKKYIPMIEVISYTNPREEDIERTLIDQVRVSERFDIQLQPFWSTPNISLLPIVDGDLFNKMMSYFPDFESTKLAYEELRYDLGYVPESTYNLFGGYPEYIGSPKIVRCNCCEKLTDFYFQLEGDTSYHIDFDGLILYCYRCQNTNTLFFMLS